MHLTIPHTEAIIYLTRQPKGTETSRPGKISVYISKLPILPKIRAAYLFFRLRIATMSNATVKITMNSSYVLISISPFRQDSDREAAAPRLPG